MYERLKESPKNNILNLMAALSGILFILIMIVMNDLTSHISRRTFYNILDFEFAGFYGREYMDNIVHSWNLTTIDLMKTLHYIDFLYLVIYSSLLFSLTLIVTRSLSRKSVHGDYGYKIVLLPIVAACLDVIENICLLLILDQPYSYFIELPLIAAFCALVKFLFIIIAIIWILVGLTILLLIGLRGKDSSKTI